jgi:RTX calcium-binding nonapeptide repeat (4 copies)/WD40-like Beta Propeller Repeat
VRVLALFVAGLFLAQGLSAGLAKSSTPAAELSFTVRSGSIDYSAVCVGSASAVRQARRMTGLFSYYQSARWSPDGSVLAADVWRPRDNAIRLLRADGAPAGRATRPLADEHDERPAWSPDGSTLAFEREFGARGGTWLTSGGVERRISPRHAYALDWSPTGDLIAIDVGGEFDNVIELIRPTGELVRRIEVPRVASFEDGVSWSPDGTRLALGGGVIVDRTGNRLGRYAAPSRNPSDTTYPARMPAWSPDGAFVAYELAPSWSDARTNVRVLGKADLYLGPVDGSAPIRLTNTPDIGEGAPAWRRGARPAGIAQTCVRYGSARRDVIRGTAGDDFIVAGSGNDLVYGGVGNDYVAGGKGHDAIVGGPGRDALSGDLGNDGFNTRDRNRDYVTGGWGRDRAFADPQRLDVLLGVERVVRR